MCLDACLHSTYDQNVIFRSQSVLVWGLPGPYIEKFLGGWHGGWHSENNISSWSRSSDFELEKIGMT